MRRAKQEAMQENLVVYIFFMFVSALVQFWCKKIHFWHVWTFWSCTLSHSHK